MSRQALCTRVAALVAGVALVAATGAVSAGADASGALHITKACGDYNGQAGSHCTITASNLKAINPGTKVIYLNAAGATGLDSNIVLDTGTGSHAFGHVTLSFATMSGVVTLSSGNGKLRGIRANVVVTFNPDTGLWYWDGTYSFERN
jgi:hypothetical protein